MSSDEGPGPVVTRRLAYLLKHAQLRMAELSEEALAPCGINGRELGVLNVLFGREPGIPWSCDDTRFVDDRRRNVVELTEAGLDTVTKANAAAEIAESQLLAPLSPAEAQQLRESLQAIVAAVHG